MLNNLNLKNIDDLIYLEGSCFENLEEKDLSDINTFYSKKINTNKKHIINNKSLFIYDYRPCLIDFTNPDWKEKEIFIEKPAIQPHDSRIKSISLKENIINFKGSGNSYMNYADYNFEINFNGLDNLLILESNYSNFQKDAVKSLSLKELNLKISNLNFREVFLNQSATLKEEINFVFIDYKDENIDEEKRKIIVVKFEYDSLHLNCEPVEVKTKISKKLKK